MNNKEKCSGVVVPMVTPFTESGNIDEESTCRIIDHLCKAGVAGIFILGTTGEGVSISPEQKRRLAEITAGHTNGRARTYASISDCSPAESVKAANAFFESGIDAAVAHVPWYYPLTDEEMYQYFKNLADQLNGPLMLYNIPKTTHMSISVETVERLREHPRIIGIKDSSGDPSLMEAMLQSLAGITDFSYVIGSAALSVKAIESGASGIVPSTANLVPELYQQLYENTCNGDYDCAQKFQDQTDSVSKVYQGGRSLGQSLGALKMMMHLAGLCGPAMLPPLVTMPENQKAEIAQRMKELKLLE